MCEIDQPGDREERGRPARLPNARDELERRALILASRKAHESLEVTRERPERVAFVTEALRLPGESLRSFEPAADRFLFGQDEDVLHSAKAHVAGLWNVRPRGRVDWQRKRAPRETAMATLCLRDLAVPCLEDRAPVGMRLAHVRSIEGREDDRAKRAELVRVNRSGVDAALEIVPVAVAERRPAPVLGEDRIVERKSGSELHDLPAVHTRGDLARGEHCLEALAVVRGERGGEVRRQTLDRHPFPEIDHAPPPLTGVRALEATKSRHRLVNPPVGVVPRYP